MVYTNPGAISNSGNSYFTNQRSKIAKIDLNLIRNGEMMYEFITNFQSVVQNVNPNVEPDIRIELAQQRARSHIQQTRDKYKDTY